MKSWYIDPVTKERHLLVRTASEAVVLREATRAAVDPDMLLVLRNQQVIMRLLEETVAKNVGQKEALRAQQAETKTRVAQLETEIKSRKTAELSELAA